MDEILKTRLKELGLLPLELDSEAQRRYREQGIDPGNLETNLAPGTPTNILEAYRRISENVLRLNYIEREGLTGKLEYHTLEKSIREDLHKLTFKCDKETPPFTGSVGLNRDT